MITFQTFTQEEKFSHALAEIYILLLKLAKEKEQESRASEGGICTLTVEHISEV